MRISIVNKNSVLSDSLESRIDKKLGKLVNQRNSGHAGFSNRRNHNRVAGTNRHCQKLLHYERQNENP